MLDIWHVLTYSSHFNMCFYLHLHLYLLPFMWIPYFGTLSINLFEVMNYQKLLDPHPQIVNSFVHFFGRRTSQFLLATQAPPSRGWRDAFFDFRDEIEILLPSVSCLETRSRFFHKISGFETRSRFLFTESQASRRDRDFLSFDLEIRDEIEIFQWHFSSHVIFKIASFYIQQIHILE